MFAAPAATALRKGLEAEAERLAAFWNTNVTLEYADP